ncbi:MAG: biopolymer transporter ExbD [Dysgonomonas sp.]|nr:biopolymer transporter ExbD [Dysgonomonas sp.]
MGKIKSKKHDTFIDMTAMSDVTVLLLTFFMLTATFIPKEPVQVLTPMSVSEIKIPEANVLTILIDPQGHIYLNIDRPEDKRALIESIGKQYNINFTPQQVMSFVNQSHIGMPMQQMQKFLDLSLTDQDQVIKNGNGVPIDTIISPKNELAVWVQTAKDVNPDLAIAIKSDQSTPYHLVKNVMSTLQDLKENRYSLITSLKGMPEGF